MEPEPATKKDLPEDILCHILSFLPTVDAIRASFVSPDWRNLWHVLPTLHFDIKPFRAQFQTQSCDEIRQRFAEFICQTLFLRRPLRSPLHKLHLSFDYTGYHRHQSHIDSWVRYAVKYKVTELDLNLIYMIPKGEMIDFHNFVYYQFPFAVLINSSVQVLKLRSCDFCLPTTIQSLPIKISSLKSIYLYGPMSNLEEEEIFDMVNLCVNLEFLSLSRAMFRNNLIIVSPKLKVLILSDFKETDIAAYAMDITAPNLRVMRFDSFYMGQYFLSDAHSLVEASVIFDKRQNWDFFSWKKVVKLIAGVERLTIQNMWVFFEFEHMEDHAIDYNGEDHKEFESDSDNSSSGDPSDERFYGIVPPEDDSFSEEFAFSNLKHLELLTGYTIFDLLGLELLLKMCPRLESMVLTYYYSTLIHENLAEKVMDRPINLQIPNLRRVVMKYYRGTKSELYVIELLERYGVVLESIVTLPHKE